METISSDWLHVPPISYLPKAIFYALQSGLQTLGFGAVYLSINCVKKSQENPYFLASHVTLVALFLSRAAQLFLPVSLS